jgi:ubiquinone/menaquinone biosynthesis C-methylase UbiE
MKRQQLEVDQHMKVIQEEFSRQAENFGKEGLTLSSKDYLSWAIQNMCLKSHEEVLDVAAGTGHLSRAIAPYVKKVTAIDVTETMLRIGEKEAQREGISNIIFDLGIAERLPYTDSSFNKVASRLVFHHFVEPLPPLEEMIRVCCPEGKIIAIDLVSPENKKISEMYNHIERLRDPSHTLALSLTELTQIMKHPGLELELIDSREIKVDLQSWMDLTQTPLKIKEKITQTLRNELSGGESTGMRPFEEEGKIKFLQTWVLAVSRKVQ